MKKLQLNLNDLKVKSFETKENKNTGKGTVIGQEPPHTLQGCKPLTEPSDIDDDFRVTFRMSCAMDGCEATQFC